MKKALPRSSRPARPEATESLLSPRWLYVFRICCAAALALGASFYFQLEKPYSAATTVFLVANPVQGLVLSKGFWRVVGTLFGAASAVFLIAAFSQAPLIFFSALGVWLGLCCTVATVFRFFRGYAAAVAGYTVSLVINGAIDAPYKIFLNAVGRSSVVSIGVISLAICSMSLSRRAASSKLLAALKSTACKVARFAGQSWTGSPATDRNQLVDEIHALDELLELSLPESREARAKESLIRTAMAEMFVIVTGSFEYRETSGKLDTEASAAIVSGACREAADLMEISKEGCEEAALEIVRSALNQIREQAQDEGIHSSPHIVGFHRQSECLEEIQAMISSLVALRSSRPASGRERFKFHVDFHGAFENGLRAFAAVILTGALWMVTRWSSGPVLFFMVSLLCGLVSINANPAAASVEYAKGVVAAVVAGFIYTFFVMPGISDFPQLIGSMLPFWCLGLVASTYPKTAMAGVGYLIVFLTAVMPANPMVYDLTAYLNSAVAFSLSGVLTVLVFRVILPRNPQKAADRTLAAIWQDLRALAARESKVTPLSWGHLQHQRLSRIGMLTRSRPEQRDRMCRDGFTAVHLGRSIFRIRAAMTGEGVGANASTVIYDGLADLRKVEIDRGALANRVRGSARRLDGIAPDTGRKSAAIHLVATEFHGIADLLESESRNTRKENDHVRK